MFTAQQALKQYSNIEQTVQAEYATPHQLTKMLFSGALRALAIAETAMKQKQFQLKGEQLARAINIIEGLDDSLDMEKGGELAENLRGLYIYMVQRLYKSSFDNDPVIVREVSELLREISSAWDNIPLEDRNKTSVMK
jgi:flagellar secretion chaperone FliS